MIEAAILGKPVLSMLSEEFSSTQTGTIHFHYLLPENGGFLRIASGLEEHVKQLSARLADLEGGRLETSRFVASFIRPHGVDQSATPIFADAIEQLGSAPVPRHAPVPVWSVLWRPALFGAAFVQATANLVQRSNSTKARRRIANFFRRTGKNASRAGRQVGRAGRIASGRVRHRTKVTTKQWQKAAVKLLRLRW
jgi:hypothetical protein